MLNWGKKKRDTPEQKAAPRAAAPPTARPAKPSESQNIPRPALTLPQMLLEEGKASREQLQAALTKQKETGAFLGEILIEEGILDEQSLISFLAKHCKVPHLSLLDYLIDDEIIELVPKDMCLQCRLLPIDKLGKNLTVAMVNPLDKGAIQQVCTHCPTLRIKPILCAYKHFQSVTQKVFGTDANKPARELTATSFGLSSSQLKKEAEKLRAEMNMEAEPAEEAQVKVPQAKAKETSPPKVITDAVPLNSDSIFMGVFRPKEVPEDAAPPSEATADPEDTENIMKEVTDVMMDSMRDTYDVISRRVALFRGLSSEEVAKLFSCGITVEHEEGDLIFDEGQPGDALYVILGGEVSISDTKHEIARLKQGDMFGEMALISNETRSASAIALSSTSLLALTNDTIQNVMPPNVALQVMTNIVITLSSRLRTANVTQND
jgi:hypothetical protein